MGGGNQRGLVVKERLIRRIESCGRRCSSLSMYVTRSKQSVLTRGISSGYQPDLRRTERHRRRRRRSQTADPRPVIVASRIAQDVQSLSPSLSPTDPEVHGFSRQQLAALVLTKHLQRSPCTWEVSHAWTTESSRVKRAGQNPSQPTPDTKRSAGTARGLTGRCNYGRINSNTIRDESEVRLNESMENRKI